MAIRRRTVFYRGACLPLCWLALWLMPCSGAAEQRSSEYLEKRLRRKLSPTAQRPLFREYAVACLRERHVAEGAAFLATWVRDAAPSLRRSGFRGSQLDLSSAATDAFILLSSFSFFHPASPQREDVVSWLFASDERLSLFLDTLSPLDDWPACFRHFGSLFDHDPHSRDAFFRLILALAVVWDQPRPPPHHQMGQGQLPFAPDVCRRYDYFKGLFGSREAELPYRSLSANALALVVDAPVPLSELVWARTNVKGSASSWHKRFDEIRYDDPRLAAGAFQWPHGPYTLAGIQERGGICVDQAYFSAVTAKAFGIPAMMFVGEGTRGPHAWFGYMRSKGQWELDVGRYKFDRYATGHSVDPQTNQPMTDHDVVFACNRSLRSPRFEAANRLGRQAAALLQLGDEKTAFECAGLARKTVRLYEPAWGIQMEILVRREDKKGILELLARKANAFQKYPDYVATIRQQQADLLKHMGRPGEAERLLERGQDRLGKERDDLARTLGASQVMDAFDRGDYAKARTTLEELLRDQRREGYKAIPLIRAYLELTKATEQTAEAAQFLRRYLDSMNRRGGQSMFVNETVFLELLLEAYENAGDTSRARRVREKLGQSR